MKFIVAIFLSFGVAHSSSLLKNLLPVDIVDDVKAEIELLRGMVIEVLKKSAEDLDSILTNVTSFSDGVYKQQSIEVDDLVDSALDYLDQIYQVADKQGQNISACTEGSEAAMEHLPADAKGLTRDCVDVEVTKSSTVVATSHYNTDVLINKVDQFEFQVTTCRGDDDCLISLVTQIYQAKVDIPRQITEEVNKAQSDVKPLEENMQECAEKVFEEFSELLVSVVYSIVYCLDSSYKE